MLKIALFFSATIGTLPEGLTVKEEPIHNNKSQVAACCKALTRSYFGNFYPKYIIESNKFPPQF
jgi:hypothetical protein